LAALWPDAPVQRCTVHKHRNLLAHAPERLHDDYRDTSMPRRGPRSKRGARPSSASGG
jgi:transposase-like protein